MASEKISACERKQACTEFWQGGCTWQEEEKMPKEQRKRDKRKLEQKVGNKEKRIFEL